MAQGIESVDVDKYIGDKHTKCFASKGCQRVKIGRIGFLFYSVKLRLAFLKHKVTKLVSRSRKGNLNSSLSDDEDYPEFCRIASSNASKFRTFRSASSYTQILEHVSPALGAEYLRQLRKDSFVYDKAKSLCSLDRIGSPVKVNYPGIGLASPSTLRYLKVYSDLRELFGPLEGMAIGEIGVGYGGQCRIIGEADEPLKYYLLDLPDVLALANRFLEENEVLTDVELCSAFAVPNLKLDLVISNYAFSELRRQAQLEYVDKVLQHSKRGYLTFNSISPKDFDGMRPAELADYMDGIILKEQPLTYPGNKIVAWSR